MVLRREDALEVEIIRDEAQLEHRASSGLNDRGMIAWEVS
jgi:hypothetical protein